MRPGEAPRAWVAEARGRLRFWAGLARLLPLAGTAAWVGAAALGVVVGALPLALVVSTSRAVHLLPHAAERGQAAPGLVAALAVAVTALIVQSAFAPVAAAAGEVIARRVDGACLRALMAAALSDVPLPELDRAESAELFSDARSAFQRATGATPGDAVGGALALIPRYTQLAGAVILAWLVIGPLTATVLAVTAVAVRYGQRHGLELFSRAWQHLAAGRRRAAYLREVGLSAVAAKEIRLLGILPWLLGRHRADSREHLAQLWRARRRLLGRPFLGYAAVAVLGAGVAFTALVRAAATGDGLSLFAVAVAVQAILVPIRFGVFFPDCDLQTQFGLQAYHRLDAALGMHRSSSAGNGRVKGATRRAAVGAAGVEQRSEPVAPPQREIHLDAVTFQYPNSARRVLNECDLRLPVGSSTALVGLNGAGKSTLVKVLTRLYEPTSGRLLADGQDTADVSAAGWQRHFAVLFQDYVRFGLSAAENIGLGAPHLMNDRDAILAAAHRAGADQLLHALPEGLDTPLSRHHGGRDLSGGQWQRLALARAFLAIAGGASILVLDEPTAQLDVRGEARFYDEFLDLTGGLTTLLISHRFATTRRADQIAVLEGGRIREHGTHDTLMAEGGRYASMFTLQAQRFTPAGHASDRGQGGGAWWSE